mmetsp:Transcript_134139/g.267683  ORF Transcript_134139/g.267683 Transcript_134139/m.267683 type:complete len:666 (+) Transcript_134139:72-2069(+)
MSLGTDAHSLAEGGKVIMRKYRLYTGSNDVMGQGTFSICRKGVEIGTGRPVAIKIYKEKRGSNAAVKFQKFIRQIEVLEELQRPLTPPDDGRLWCSELEGVSPAKLFMQLIDYSRTEDGKPGPDPEDGELYVIVEPGTFTLKDYLKTRRDQNCAMSADTVRSLTRGIMLVVAGLHSKGLVHLDLKPENLMFFNGCLKVIDVDSCVRVGTVVSIMDSSLSFSPCYCSPEWAAFLIEDSPHPKIHASAGLDVWSIGMTISELVTLEPVLKNTFAGYKRHGRSHREATFHFLEWLSQLKVWPTPSRIRRFEDKGLLDLLGQWLLVPGPAERKSLSEALAHKFVARSRLRKATTGPLMDVIEPEEFRDLSFQEQGENDLHEHAKSQESVNDQSNLGRPFVTIDATRKVVHNGMLWKLNTDGDITNKAHFLQMDFWIDAQGSLAYFSLEEQKMLAMIDSSHMAGATITRLGGAARSPAFKVAVPVDHDEATVIDHIFACETEEDLIVWMEAFHRARLEMMRTMHLGAEMAHDLNHFKLEVKNRRKSTGVTEDSEGYKSLFRSKLQKVITNGNRMKPGDWRERDMWLSKNGCLVYWSQRDERELIYYTHSDLEGAVVTPIDNEESFYPWTFQVQLAERSGLEFAPGEFAAESEEMRDRWIASFQRFKKIPE